MRSKEILEDEEIAILSKFSRQNSSANYKNLIKIKENIQNQYGLRVESHTSKVLCCALSIDDKYLVSGGADKTVKIWNLQENFQINSFNGHTKDVNCVSFSNNMKFIASAGNDKTIRIWPFKTNDFKEKILEGHTKEIFVMVISNNNQFIISGGKDCTIRIWDIKNNHQQILLEHTNAFHFISISNDDTFCIVAGEFPEVFMINLKGNIQKKLLFNFGCSTNALALSKDNKNIAVISYCKLSVYKIEKPNVIEDIDVRWGSKCLIFCRNNQGSLLYIERHSDATNNSIKLWKFKQLKEEHKILEEKHAIDGMVLSKCERFIIYYCEDSIIYRGLNVNDSKIAFPGHTKWISCFTHTNNSNIIITGGKDGTIRIWDLKHKHEIFVFNHHTYIVTCLIISNDNKQLISGSRDKTVKLWNIERKIEEATLIKQDYFIETLAVTKDNKYIVTGSNSKFVIVYCLSRILRSLNHKTHGKYQAPYWMTS